MSESGSAIDRHVPHASRIYDYLLGGSNNFEVDRQAANAAMAALPGGIDEIRLQVQANRRFLGRAVRYLADEANIRQFLDAGTGIPSDDNVHAVAQAVAPETRVVYSDIDPVVLAHARELLASASPGTVDYVDADLRTPSKVLREARRTLDFDRPIAVMLVAVLHFLTDNDSPLGIVRELLDAVPSGSYLVVSHMAADHPEFPEMADYARRLNEVTHETFVVRGRADVTEFLTGLDLVEPGVVPLKEWRPDGDGLVSTAIYGAVARKP
jgi:hypothetical protein